MLLHERLLQLREKMGLSQTEIASRLGMARTTYAGYENGSREPDLETLSRIASFHGKSIEWLVNGVEYNFDKDVEKLIEDFVGLDEGDQIHILNLIERLKKERK